MTSHMTSHERPEGEEVCLYGETRLYYNYDKRAVKSLQSTNIYLPFIVYKQTQTNAEVWSFNSRQETIIKHKSFHIYY